MARPASVITTPDNSSLIRRRGLLILLGLLLVAVRVPLMSQSLWYDEMYTVVQYVHGPLSHVVGGKAYSPNNHVLHTLLCRLAVYIGQIAGCKGDVLLIQPDALLRGGPISVSETSESILRLPSMLAGVGAAIALAWSLLVAGFRRISHDRCAIYAGFVLLVLIAGTNPWLIAFNVEARGYSLLLLVSIISTAILPAAETGRGKLAGYGFSLAMMIYTVPIGLVVIGGHGLVMLIHRRAAFSRWIIAAGGGLLLAIVLYLPMATGMMQYFSTVHQSTTGFSEFFRASLTCSLTGDTRSGWLLPIIALLLLATGSFAAWKTDSLRPLLLTFASATTATWIGAMIAPAVGENRFVLWLIPWQSLAIWGIIKELSAGGKTARGRCGAGIFAGLAMLAWNAVQYESLLRTPAQPIRDALLWIERVAPEDSQNNERQHVVCLYMAALETLEIYGANEELVHRPVNIAYTVSSLQQNESQSGVARWAVIPYESFLQRDVPDLWAYVTQHYQLARRLKGRLSDVTVWEIKRGDTDASHR